MPLRVRRDASEDRLRDLADGIGGGVRHRSRLKALLGEVADDQFPQALVVVDDENAFFQLSHARQGTGVEGAR